MNRATIEMQRALLAKVDEFGVQNCGIMIGIDAVLDIYEWERVRPLLQLIRRLTDPDECSYDHHGGCQAHGFSKDEGCPHADALKLLLAERISR